MKSSKTRRQFLTISSAVLAGSGVSIAALPLVASLSEPEDKNTLVSVDISTLAAGKTLRVKWQGQAVWIIHRTPKMLENLKKERHLLLDPDSKMAQQPFNCVNETRSIKEEIFVVIGVCTHLGCAPKPRFTADEIITMPNQQAGFLCPCHAANFDAAGRVYQNKPATRNLFVPLHSYENATTIIIGA